MGELTEHNISSTLHQNPFSEVGTGYGFVTPNSLSSVYKPGTPEYDFHHDASRQFMQLVQGEHFPCVAGRAALNTKQLVLSAYTDMTSPQVAEGVCHDLWRYRQEPDIKNLTAASHIKYTSFVAAFRGPKVNSEFEAITDCYTLLRNMHEADLKAGFTWDSGASFDIESPHFDYSIGGERYVTVLLHPHASNPDRQAPLTFVAFNPRVLFTQLRANGLMDRVTAASRKRQLNPFKDQNPVFGEQSEFITVANVLKIEEPLNAEREARRQVLGRCPFHH